MKSKRQAKIMEIISTKNVETQEQLLKELQESFGGPTGENNSPRSKSFFDGVKKFFDDLTR